VLTPLLVRPFIVLERTEDEVLSLFQLGIEGGIPTRRLASAAHCDASASHETSLGGERTESAETHASATCLNHEMQS